MITKRLTLAVGPPGSGKSTLALDYCSKGGVTYINQDLQGKDHIRIFEEALSKGEDIVIDRMNFSKGQRNRYLDPAKALDYSTHITVLHEPYDMCLARCLSRKDHLTIKDEESARAALHTFFTKYERVSDDEADAVLRIWPEGYKPKAIICDLDGTLCDIDHRLHFVRDGKRNWPGFFAGIPGDKVNRWCAEILSEMERHYKVVFCSGRPSDYREATIDWLEKEMYDEGGCKYLDKYELYMRSRNDSRKDNIAKEILLDFEILTRYTPYFVIDDRQQVVDMWRSRGYTCLQCAKGDF